MKKKIIALIMIIPLIFLITLFSVGKVVSIFIDIPVSGIKITTQNDNGFIDIDMAEYTNDIYLTAKVEPSNAKIQDYNFVVDGVGDSSPADISVNSDGKLIVNGDGKVKITAVSADKGFTDSIIVTAYSSKVISITPLLADVGDNSLQLEKQGDDSYFVEIESGLYDFSPAIYPKELADSTVIWSSENSNILEINPITGKAKAKLSGQTKVSAICPSGLGGEVEMSIDVKVIMQNTASGITVNGIDSNVLLLKKGVNNVNFIVEKADLSDIIIGGDDIAYLQNYQFEQIGDSDKQLFAKLNLSENHPDELTFELWLDNRGIKTTVKLLFNDFAFNVYTSYHRSPSENIINQKNNTTVTYVAEGEPFDESVIYQWSVDNDVIELQPNLNGLTCDITAKKTGESQIEIKAFKDDDLIYTITKTVNVIKGIYSVDFISNAQTFGIENVLAVGDTVIKNNVYTTYRTPLEIRIKTDGGVIENYTGTGLDFSSSDNSVIKPFPLSDGFKVVVGDDGITDVTAEWEYADYFGVNVSGKVKLRGVKNAVVVDNYEHLKKATEEGRKIVLANNIFLGYENMSEAQLKGEAKKMFTDYDWQFYENCGKPRPELYYLIEFKNDVFGNGYFINANNFTTAKDIAGLPLLFRGPLNFVATDTASVKAQDNVSFLVRTKGITIDNIVLRGCSNESLYCDGGFDLSLLNYVGTTLEIKSDCRVLNSRVENGRTTVRIFGGDTTDGKPIISSFDKVAAKDERINVSIESCILSNAREFILKIGSNRAVISEGVDEATFKPATMKNGEGKEYSPFDNKKINDSYFYDKYVITDVTLENSVLTTSGLFSIGMETHFSGGMLAGYILEVNNWKNLASTSYASILRLKGDVKLLDWKPLSNVDSSTLIETTSDAQQFLSLNISAMIDKVANQNGYENLVSTINDKKYVHGGIAFYGGGYNYSLLDTSEWSVEPLNEYRINLRILAEGVDENLNDPLFLQGELLPLAAGTSDFRFYMYGSNSSNNYINQQDTISTGDAFNLAPAKV